MYTYIYTAKVYLAKVVDRKLHVLWGWVGLNLVATSALLISTLLLQWVTNEDTVHCLQIVLSNRLYWKESAMLRLHYTSSQIYMRLHYFAWTSRVESPKYHRKAAKCRHFLCANELESMSQNSSTYNVKCTVSAYNPDGDFIIDLPHHMQIGRRMWGRRAQIEHNNNLDTYIWMVCESVWI